MFKLIRSILFLMPAETAHHFTLNTLKLLCAIPMVKPILSWINQANNDTKSKNVFGLNFKNVVGLAAGFDKNAKYIDELAALGFGFIEMPNVSEAKGAIKNLNYKTIGRNKIRVKTTKN